MRRRILMRNRILMRRRILMRNLAVQIMHSFTKHTRIVAVEIPQFPQTGAIGMTIFI